MRIAVCDWDTNFTAEIKSMIYTYAELHRIDIVADCYTAGETLLSCGINYNIIFLGYKLTGINGLKTAEKVRSKNSVASIVFISEYTKFVFDAFKVNPYRFLIKPVNKHNLFEVLDSYFQKFGNDYPLWIKCRENTVCLNTDEIYFLEADNKHCYIHLKSETLKCSRTMAKVFELMPKNHFSKINRAFVVNLNFIKKYNKEEICLKNDVSLHISRNFLKPFKEDYRRFSCPKEI